MHNLLLLLVLTGTVLAKDPEISSSSLGYVIGPPPSIYSSGYATIPSSSSSSTPEYASTPPPNTLSSRYSSSSGYATAPLSRTCAAQTITLTSTSKLVQTFTVTQWMTSTSIAWNTSTLYTGLTKTETKVRLFLHLLGQTITFED
jgi:hypothetical protein